MNLYLADSGKVWAAYMGERERRIFDTEWNKNPTIILLC